MKKTKKRFLALLLTLTMVLSMGMQTFAVGTDSESDIQTQDIQTETETGTEDNTADVPDSSEGQNEVDQITDETSEAAKEETADEATLSNDTGVSVQSDDTESAQNDATEPAVRSNVSDKPADGTTSGQPFAAGTGGSQNFRIPAMVTLDDGTIIAAADARWNTSADAGGLDTIVSRSSDNGANWNYTFANYLGDNGNTYVKESATFIDPALATDGSTIYMLADLFPGGVALNSSNQKPEAAAAFDGQGRLKLAQSSSSDYSYYLGEFENGRAQIFGADGNPVADYTVDEYFNLYQGEDEVSNLFFSDAPYQVVKTSYLYLTKSTDKGATWSAPTLINVKADDEQFYGVGPGTGIVTSDGTILFSAYEWNRTDSSQRSSFIYSTDGGETWERTENATGNTWSSENQLVELNDGTIRMFFRNGSNQICYVDATGNADEGYTWGSIVQTGVSNNSNCQISALKYSRTINGKEAILLSCPTDSSWGSRSAGKIFVGLVNDDGTMDFNSFSATAVTNGTFQYSCLTEQSDGSVGLLYENGSASIQYTNFQIENLVKDAQIGDPDPGFVSEDGTLINSLNFAATDGAKTVEFRGLSDSQYLTVTTSSEAVATAGVDGSSVTVTPVGEGTATITATVQTNSRSVEDGSQYELTVTVSGVDEAYTGSITENPGGTSYVLDTDGIDDGGEYLIVYDGHALENTDGETSTGYRDVTVSENEVTGTNESNDDYLLWTFEGSGDRFSIRNTNAYIYLYQRGLSGETLDTTEHTCTLSGSNGRYTIYGSNRYLGFGRGLLSRDNFRCTNDPVTVSLYLKTTNDPTWSTDPSKLQEQINAANDLTADNYTTDSWAVLQDAVETAESLSSSEYSSESEAQAAQNTIDQAAQRIAEAIAALQRKPFTEELSVAVGQSISVTVDGTMTQGPDETFATAVIDGNTMTITGVAAGTTTVIVGAGTYNITVTEIPDGDFSNIGDLSFVSNTGDTTYSRGKTVSHLILTPGISYDLNLNGADGYNVTWKSENASIATVGQNGTVTGVTPGETVVIAEITDEEGNIVGRHSATVTVLDIEPIYENSRPSDNGERIVEIYVNEIQDSRLYYVQNDEGEYKEVFADTAIYISTEAAWAMTFFGAPVDENYALTYMSAANNLDQTNWYAIQDYSNMRQTTFFQNKGSLNNEDTHLYTDNEIIAMLQGAKELGADGGFWFTRGTDATNSCQAIINVISERLPSLEKSIKSVIHSGETVDYTEGMQIYPGDTLVYDITVHRYETEYGIVYSNAQLRELLSGAEFSDGTTSKNITSDLGTSGDPAPARDFLYEAEYTVRDSDLDSMITNTVSLSYGYRAAYSTGELTAEAEAVAEVSVLAFDPDDYIIDFGSPITVDFTGKTSYNFVSGSANFGTVQTDEMEVTYTPNAVLTEADTVRITNERGAVYTFTVYPASSVYYEEGFASYDGSWSGGSATTGNQAVSIANDKTVDLYGYDDLYASANGNSNDSVAVSSTKNGTATFTFNGTGLDIYALTTQTTQTSGSMSLWLYEGEGTDGTLLKLGYVDTSNTWLEENNGNYYNTPVFSYKDLTAGTYTVKIIVNSGTISLDGFRVYHTQGDAYESVYAADQEDQAFTDEVRDITIAGSTYNLEEIDDWYKYGSNIIDAVYDASNKDSGAVILASGNTITADADMINNGPKNEIYLESGQTIAMRLTASAYDKVAVGMRSLNGGTVSYQINNQPESTLSSTVDMYYGVQPNNGMIVIENTGDTVLALTKIKVTSPVYEVSGVSLFTMDADTMAFALQCIADETGTVETADAALTVNIVDANGNAVAETVLTANGTVGETHTFAAADIQTVAEGILPEGYELTGEAADVEVVYGESDTTELQADKAAEEEPAEDEDNEDDSFLSKLGNAIKNVVNTVTGFFKSLFRW